MTNDQHDHTATLHAIVATELGGTISSVHDLTTGYSGWVYAVDVARLGGQQQVVIKLTPPERSPSPLDETVDERVSAVRPSNFAGAYRLLHQSGLPLPDIVAARSPSPSIPFFYQVMTRLDGVSIVDFLEAHKQESHPQLQQLIGAALGQLHCIVRGYDGWVDQAAPYPLDWKAAFFQSLDHKLRAAQQLNAHLTQHIALIERFIAQHKRIWSTPAEFVFSEFTGFQGMATCVDDRWRLTGIIDIEDHRFVDQRYVLAGHEFFMTFGGGVLPPAFWEGYTEHKAVDPSYNATKAIFKLHYVLAWLPVCYSAAWRGEPSQRGEVIRYFESFIDRLCRG